VIVDEIDMASQALDVAPWRPEAYEQARARLRDAMAEAGPRPEAAPVPAVAPLRGRGFSRAGSRRRGTLGTRGKVGIGAGIGAVAAAAALVLVSTSTPQPAAPTGSASRSAGAPARSTGSTGAQRPLVTLAAYLAAEPAPKGDATLVEREEGEPGHALIKVWDLYADDGRYFFSPTEAGLPAQVEKNNSQGDGIFGREVAAAIYAVKGDLGPAELKMASAPGPGTFASAQDEDGWVWEDSEDALVAGAGNPQVRAGVLRLVSALPDITVTQGTLDGQPTLTLADSERGGSTSPKYGPKYDPKTAEWSYEEAITINADTGIPLQIATGPVGHVTVGIRYVVTRVSLADIAAGKLPSALSTSAPHAGLGT
jgi:hypothetical protein